MTVDWPTGIHVWHQLGDNILNDWDSVLYHAVYTLNQGPVIALFLLQPVYRDLRIKTVSVGVASFPPISSNSLR